MKQHNTKSLLIEVRNQESFFEALASEIGCNGIKFDRGLYAIAITKVRSGDKTDKETKDPLKGVFAAYLSRQEVIKREELFRERRRQLKTKLRLSREKTRQLKEKVEELKAELRQAAREQASPKSMDENDRHFSDLLSDSARAIENALNVIRDAGHPLIYQTYSGELQRHIDGLRCVRLTHYTVDEDQSEPLKPYKGLYALHETIVVLNRGERNYWTADLESDAADSGFQFVESHRTACKSVVAAVLETEKFGERLTTEEIYKIFEKPLIGRREGWPLRQVFNKYLIRNGYAIR